jgi:hypothetical protein
VYFIDDAILAEVLAKVAETNVRVAEALEVTNQFLCNPYANMSETTANQKVNVRDLFLRYSKITDNAPICMYSGIKHSKVLCAHILPKSTKNYNLRTYSMEAADINDPKNLLWLCPGIEFAFDRTMLSFIPRIGEGLRDQYVMFIWDQSCLDLNLGVDTDQTIRSVYREGQALSFTMISGDERWEHQIFKRCLAIQALWSCSTHKDKCPPSMTTVWDLGDYSSLNEEKFNEAFKQFRHTNLSIVWKEISEEKED